MLLNLAENNNLLVLMDTHLSHLLKESRMGGGEGLKGMHQGVKLRSQYGNGRLKCSWPDWWNIRSSRWSSKSSLKCGHWWCYHGRGSKMCRIARQLIPFVESESLSTKAAALESRFSRKAQIL